MAAEFIINTEHETVLSYAWGVLTLADIKDHRIRLLQHTGYNAKFRQIIHLADAESIELTSKQIYSLAQEPLFSSQSRRAIVAAPLLHFGLSRIFHAYSDSQTVHVFRQLGEAAGWVYLPEKVAEKSFEEIRQGHELSGLQRANEKHQEEDPERQGEQQQ